MSVVSSPSKRCGSYCCWQGSTASRCDSINGDYSGCNRTLCTHYAAKKVCENLNYDNRSWRLPTLNELQRFGAYSINKGSSGLMLCDSSSNHGSARCADHTSGCNFHCYAHNVWGAPSAGSSSNYPNYYLTAGSWSWNGYGSGNPFSVRCVTDF